MKNLIVIALFSLLPLCLSAQVQLKGNVKNNQEPIGWANVVLLTSEGKPVTGDLTKEDGSFALQVKTGNYQLKITFVGYEALTKELLIDKDTDLGTLQLKQQGNNLNEVVVVAKKKLIEYKADRLIFNVENSVMANGGNATNAIAASPGILIQNGNISLLGKGSARVMINGRLLELTGQDLINYLSAISASDIKSIEVINNPPAKYEASGDGGLVNIILKKGAINAWKNTTNLAYSQSKYGFLTLNNSFFYNKDKVKFSLNAGGRTGSLKTREDLNTYYPTGVWELKSEGKENQDNASAGVALDYDLSHKTTIGLQYVGNFNNPDRTDLTKIRINDTKQQLSSMLINNADNDLNNKSHTYNAHLISTLDTLNRKLAIDVDYFTYGAKIDNNFVTNTFLPNGEFLNTNQSARNISNQRIRNFGLKVDMEHPLKFMNLSYGGRLSFVNSKADVKYYNTISGSPAFDPNRSNEFDYQERTQAIYVSGVKQLNTKLSLQLGLRLENTQTEGYAATLDQKNTNNYLKLFPTAYLSYQQNEKHHFIFNYGRRINRPSFANLNPFRSYLNSTSYSEGNPFLRPSFNDNFEFTHVYKGNLRTNVFFNVTTDGFGVIFTSDANTNTQVISRENYYKEYYYGVGESYLFKVGAWWQSQNMVYLLGSSTNFTNNINAAPKNGMQLYLTTNNTFALGKSTKVQADFFFSSKVKRGLYEVGDIYGLNIGLRQELLKNKVQVALLANDVFNTAYLKNYASVVNGIKQVYSQNNSSRFFRLSLTYNFGNAKINVKSRDFGNEEERKRTN